MNDLSDDLNQIMTRIEPLLQRDIEELDKINNNIQYINKTLNDLFFHHDINLPLDDSICLSWLRGIDKKYCLCYRVGMSAKPLSECSSKVRLAVNPFFNKFLLKIEDYLLSKKQGDNI